MNSNDKKQALGRLGELITQSYFVKNETLLNIKDYSLRIEEDGWFDDTKDFRAIYTYYDKFYKKKLEKRYTIECKTQVLFVTKEAFTIRPNQLVKCKSNDVNVFLCIPNSKSQHFTDGYAWAIRGSEMEFYNEHDPISTKYDGERILIPTTPLYMSGKLTRLFELTPTDIIELQKLSTSSYM